MTLERQIPVVAEMGRQLHRAAKAIGGKIISDPNSMLIRDLPLGEPGLWSPNRHCRLVEAKDGWVAVNLARDDDRLSVAAWLECNDSADPWDDVMHEVHKWDVTNLLTRARLLHLPVAAVGETSEQQTCKIKNPTPLTGSSVAKVIDLSSLWAGPLCGALLAEAGLAVTKVESVSRPDPTPMSTPKHDARLNGRKARISLDFNALGPLHTLIDDADILITSARPHALARLGLTPERLFKSNPRLLWIAITAHGFEGEEALRVGFGDDCAAAGGLVSWRGNEPNFIGDAIADPLTGMVAALAALEAIERGECGLLPVSLASTAAHFAELAGLNR